MNMGSSVRRTVAALLPALIRSLRAVRFRGLLESTGGEGEEREKERRGRENEEIEGGREDEERGRGGR